MSDSAYLYQTRFSSIRYEGGAQGSVKLRVPVTVTIFNTSDQTITVKNAALYPWETVFEETARQEALMAQQKAGFFGEIDEGQRDNFSIAPGQSYALEVDAKLRGVYGHPGLEFETHQFFKDYFEKQGQLPATQDDVAVPGKGAFNGQVNYLFCEALAYYCAQRNTRFTLSYVVETARGNTFSATCAVPF
jgi:hypothetical protein